MKIYEVVQTDTWDSWSVILFTTKKGAYKWIMKAYYREWELGGSDTSPDWPFFHIREKEVHE